MKEITLQIDDKALSLLSDDIRQKRSQAVVNSLGDRFLIRLFDSLSNNTKVMTLTMSENKISIRNIPIPISKYGNDRQTRK